jgi:hypothetical protein
MKELYEYRVLLVKRLKEAAGEFCEACKSFASPFENVEGDWTVHQIAAHTRDVERAVYGARIRRTLKEDNPIFVSFDADTWMAEHYSKEEALENMLAEFHNGVRETCEMLGEMPQEGWSRLSGHETMGGEFTLQLWAERSLVHIEEHLKTLKNAKNP